MTSIKKKLQQLRAKRASFIKQRENCFEDSASFKEWRTKIYEIEYDIDVLEQAQNIINDQK